MSFQFKLPDIGEGVTEGEIVEWHVKLGDVVSEDDPMVEVMTDKATVTIGAPRAGAISAIHFDVGAVANVGDVIVEINESGEASAKAAPAKAAPAKEADKDEGPAATAVGDIREGLPGTSFFKGSSQPAARANGANGSNGANGASHHKSESHKSAPSRPAAAAGGLQTVSTYHSDKPLATPATRKLARELGVDLRKVAPSGPAGRTTRDDVKAFASGGGARAAAPATAVAVQDGALEVRKPFVGIRRRIAQRMQTAKNTAAHFTFVEECHCDRLIEMRSRLKKPAQDAGVKLSYLPFIVKAVVAALKKHDVLNSALDEKSNELVYRRYYHVGIAAATDAGLMVPVIRNADQLSILELAKEIDRLGNGARDGSLRPEELSGSTFTITSLGRQGGLFATPVLNHPEVGILGVHQMKEKPVVRDGEITIGNVMLLSLSFDHRIVDGHIGAAFAYDIIEYLEEPERLFLDMK